MGRVGSQGQGGHLQGRGWGPARSDGGWGGPDRDAAPRTAPWDARWRRWLCLEATDNRPGPNSMTPFAATSGQGQGRTCIRESKVFF